MNERLWLVVFLTVGVLTVVLAPNSSVVGAEAAEAATPPRQTAALSDPQELETFLDGMADAQLASYPVAGMTVSVVQDGELLLAKGYGHADVESGAPVIADETLFRPGSISKLFIWTAMMQLVESGDLDLDADANTYLDFEIPPAYGEPITLRHLMTHTAGFEDQGLGLFVRSEEQMAPLGNYLAENMPERAFPPGEISAYSNYGASLAAYIVERTSGMPFHEYVEVNIFAPLDMQQSTFRQPPPAELADTLSSGHLYNQGRFQEGDFEFVQSYPAGALSSTASDMANFMIAHLQDGRFGETQILEEETARRMREVAFAHDSRLAGWGAGFMINEVQGVKTVGHGGDTIYFHSELVLLPDEDVGLFVSTNTDRGVFARFHLTEAFLQRYFVDAEPQKPQPPEDFTQRAGVYTGTYYPARMNFATVEKISALIQPLQVQATEEGLLMVSGLLGPEPTYWVEHSDNMFVPASENLPQGSVLLFQPEEEGEEAIEYAFFQQSAYIKQPAHASPAVHYGIIGTSVLFFLAMIIAVPTSYLIHRRYRREAPQAISPTPLGAHLARWVAWIFALLNIAFLLIFIITVSDMNNLVFGLPPYLQALLITPWISVLLVLAVAASAVLTWLRRYWTVWGRIFYTLFALVAVAYLWFLWFWNFF
ncbi:MAG TPA: serine hydrolase [Candidatus Sulfomarinibacteraceae bacterium]|nr:serine hydrolase [Candidatus Sulfomarinibacteraceae bacterium]